MHQLGGRFTNVDNSTKDPRVKRFCKTVDKLGLCEVAHMFHHARSLSLYTRECKPGGGIF